MIEYSGVGLTILVSVVLSAILIGISMLMALQQSDSEKVSSYECGFTPYSDARQKFEIQFFLVGILFIIFDLEISFLFPWVITFTAITIKAYWIMMLFLAILTAGLYFEWSRGGLDWQ